MLACWSSSSGLLAMSPNWKDAHPVAIPSGLPPQLAQPPLQVNKTQNLHTPCADTTRESGEEEGVRYKKVLGDKCSPGQSGKPDAPRARRQGTKQSHPLQPRWRLARESLQAFCST